MKKKRRTDAFSQVESFASQSEEIKSSLSSTQLVKTTKRHNVYCVQTPNGLRALKVILSDEPTIDDVQNLDNELKMANQINHLGFRKSFAKVIYQNKQALILEWVHGKP